MCGAAGTLHDVYSTRCSAHLVTALKSIVELISDKKKLPTQRQSCCNARNKSRSRLVYQCIAVFVVPFYYLCTK